MDRNGSDAAAGHPGRLRFGRPPLLLRLLSLPTHLYRLGLGRLFGHRFLMLTYRGRRSGRIRRVVLEVIEYDRATQESTVVAGWGERTAWYRNLQAAPALEVQSAGMRFAPRQRFLTTEETYAAVSRYEHRYPLAAGVFARLFDVPLHGPEAQRRDAIARLRLVAFRPLG